jgi:vesicle coat complex subunit
MYAPIQVSGYIASILTYNECTFFAQPEKLLKLHMGLATMNNESSTVSTHEIRNALWSQLVAG